MTMKPLRPQQFQHNHFYGKGTSFSCETFVYTADRLKVELQKIDLKFPMLMRKECGRNAILRVVR